MHFSLLVKHMPTFKFLLASWKGLHVCEKVLQWCSEDPDPSLINTWEPVFIPNKKRQQGSYVLGIFRALPPNITFPEVLSNKPIYGKIIK